MKLKDLVCSLEHAKRFKELGLFEDSCFVWEIEDVIQKEHIPKIRRKDNPRSDLVLYPAPTSDEILMVLPYRYNNSMRKTYRLKMRKLDNQYSVAYFCDNQRCLEEVDSSLIASLSGIILYLIDNGIVEVEELKG